MFHENLIARLINNALYLYERLFLCSAVLSVFLLHVICCSVFLADTYMSLLTAIDFTKKHTQRQRQKTDLRIEGEVTTTNKEHVADLLAVAKKAG